jgi:glucosylceramidase
MTTRRDSQFDRRSVLGGLAAVTAAATVPQPGSAGSARAQTASLQWVVSTQREPWKEMAGAQVGAGSAGNADIYVNGQTRAQTIEGFGACFNELGWDALSRLRSSERQAVLAEWFGPDGARFTLCRMPVGANDFSRDWYSYDETPGDFGLRSFSIGRDRTSLIPFIKSALEHQPKLKLWASPWSPPTWMKRNGHYASVPNRPGWPANGLQPNQVGREGEDMFIIEPRYLDAYARYFGRFIDAYAEQDIRIAMVMPQNEFNSPQPFPSCCWTPEGLATFLPHLGREMERRGVAVFFGTMERPDERLFETVFSDPQAGAVIKGVGMQWAGKGAVAAIHRAHPNLPIYQSEQECGDGKNDWRYCRYTWTLMKHYLRNGATGYEYWNLALEEGGVSRWGWAQNSLITVNRQTGSWRYNHEYWLLKHFSHFVRPGAARIETISWTGYEEMLAFQNPDGSTVMVVQNPLGEPMPIRIGVGGTQIQATLPADSFSTFSLGAG